MASRGHGHARRQSLDDHDEAAAVRLTGGQEAQHRANHREAPRDPRAPVVDGGGGRSRPRPTGDRSPRGRIAGVGVGRYLFCGTQSVNDWSPNRNVAQFPETDCSSVLLVRTERLAGGDAVGRAVDLDGRPLDPVGRERVDQGDLVTADVLVALLGWVGVRVPPAGPDVVVVVVLVVVVPPLVVEVPVEVEPADVVPPLDGAGNPAGIDERVTHRQDQHRRGREARGLAPLRPPPVPPGAEVVDRGEKLVGGLLGASAAEQLERHEDRRASTPTTIPPIFSVRLSRSLIAMSARLRGSGLGAGSGARVARVGLDRRRHRQQAATSVCVVGAAPGDRLSAVIFAARGSVSIR